jgi:phosphoribosylformylglycinamidine synthase|tara:strand:- start:412 stop:672 length:261 start_codon:yes stop_codon:yes gene_type:complete
MRKFKVTIEIMPLKSVVDPQGEAIELIIKSKKEFNASNFRVGKKIEFTISSTNKSECEKNVNKLCRDFLVNEIIEQYKIRIENEKN